MTLLPMFILFCFAIFMHRHRTLSSHSTTTLLRLFSDTNPFDTNFRTFARQTVKNEVFSPINLVVPPIVK